MTDNQTIDKESENIVTSSQEQTNIETLESPFPTGAETRMEDFNRHSQEQEKEAEKKAYEARDNPRWKNRRHPNDFEPFPIELLPEPTKLWVEAVARTLNINTSGIALNTLAFCGILAGRTLELKLKNSWSVYPCIWVCTIGMSGDGKSPMLKALPNLIRHYENSFAREYEEAYKEYKKASGVKNKGNDDGYNVEPIEPKEKRLGVKGSMTIEGLLKVNQNNPRGLYHIVDEGTQFFADLESGSRNASSGLYLSGYNGTDIDNCRASNERRVRVENALWSLIMAITPESFRTIMQGQYKTDGLLSRLCLTYPPEIEEYNKNADIPVEIMGVMSMILQELIHLDFTPDGNPNLVTLNDKTGFVESWRESIFYKKKKVDFSVEKSVLSKSEELVPRIALILLALDYAYKKATKKTPPPFVVDEKIWNRAKTITEWIIQEDLWIYKNFGFVPTDKDNLKDSTLLEYKELIISRLKENGETKFSDIRQWTYKWKTDEGKELLEKLLEHLEQQGQIKHITRENPTNKKTVDYYQYVGN